MRWDLEDNLKVTSKVRNSRSIDADLDFDLNFVGRKEVLRESNFKEDSRDVKTARKLSRRKKEAENSAPMSLVMIEDDEVRTRKELGSDGD